MPMPHRTQMQVIKRRLVGKEGADRIRELRTILDELPGYRSGPYGDIRKWVVDEIERSRTKKRVVHRDSIAVRREGAAQVALVGPPNAGKSSLLQALSSVQIKTGDYAFTTTRPVPAVTRIGGVLVQLVEIPGLIEGATGDRGGGRALLGVLRGADAIVFCHDVSEDAEVLREVQQELELAGISRPFLVAADEDGRGTRRGARATGARVSGRPRVGARRLLAGRAARRDLALDRSRARVPT
jgi:small GTP-binding protein